jgi:hypothetical protein
MNAISQITRKMKNTSLAIPAAAPAIPPKPSTAAMRATIRNIKDQCSIVSLLTQGVAFSRPNLASTQIGLPRLLSRHPALPLVIRGLGIRDQYLRQKLFESTSENI